MKPILGILLVLAFAIFIKALLDQTKMSRNGDVPNFFKKPLLSNPEQTLYWRLIDALPGMIVFAQVQLWRLIDVKDNQTWKNKINRKSLDFVICKKDFSVICVIELDDTSHETESRQRADADKDAALNAAGIKIIRWTVKNMPDRFEIARQLSQLNPP